MGLIFSWLSSPPAKEMESVDKRSPSHVLFPHSNFTFLLGRAKDGVANQFLRQLSYKLHVVPPIICKPVTTTPKSVTTPTVKQLTFLVDSEMSDSTKKVDASTF